MISFSPTDIDQLDKRYRTTFINSVSGFKSLQFVGTISKEGNTNLALFSSIFHIGANPPLTGMLVRSYGPEHDTLNNIMTTGVYTLNNVTEDYYKNAHQTSARYASGRSEFGACGFDEQYLSGFKAPFVKQATIKTGLKLQEVVPVKVNGTHIVIREIQYILLDESYLDKDGYIDQEAAGSITCCGLDSYHRTTKIARLAYAKPDNEAEELHNKTIKF